MVFHGVPTAIMKELVVTMSNRIMYATTNGKVFYLKNLVDFVKKEDVVSVSNQSISC